MPKAKKPSKKPIEQYEHKGKKRLNNPPVGLVTPPIRILTPARRPIPMTRTSTRNCSGRARRSTKEREGNLEMVRIAHPMRL